MQKKLYFLCILTNMLAFQLATAALAQSEQDFPWPTMLPAILNGNQGNVASCVKGSNDFTVCTTSFAHEGQLADTYTLYGANISPQVSWSNPPAGTAAYGIYVYDADAEFNGGNWVHWMCKVPAATTTLAENSGAAGGANLPTGSTQYPNSFAGLGMSGAAGTDYDGPMPPAGSGTHHYHFSVAPLDSSGQYLGTPVELIGLYSRE